MNLMSKPIFVEISHRSQNNEVLSIASRNTILRKGGNSYLVPTTYMNDSTVIELKIFH